MHIEIPNHGWQQIGGDMNPGTYGGIIAKADGRAIEIREIQPVREYVGDREAMEVGHPFWSREGYFTVEDLNLENADVRSALSSMDLTKEKLLELKPTSRAMAIAEALLQYGRGDEGPAGWAKDVVPDRVMWWGSKRPQGWRYLEDEDKEFRQLLRESGFKGLEEQWWKVEYQVGTYHGFRFVQAEDAETAKNKVRKWARRMTSMPMYYESYKATEVRSEDVPRGSGWG